MIDIKLIRENPEAIKKAAESKNIQVNTDHVLEIDQKYRELSFLVQTLREERNKYAKERNIEKGKGIKEKLEKEEKALLAVKEELDRELLKIPNPPKSDVKIGKNESENEIVRKYKEPTKLDFKPRDHLELGELLNIIDIKRAAKVSGARFDYLINEGALLEFALKQFAFDILTKEGFIPVIPPALIKKEIMDELGYTQMEEEENIFSLDKDNLYLVGTSEQSIVPMFKDETLRKEDLPKRFAGFSTCFRREAGSYGKDTRGIFRVHQFDKVEMVSFVEEGKDDEEHEYLLSLEEKLFKMLEIPYQVVKMCTGDLGFPAARKYDIEAWVPSQNKYREVTSTSTTTDFQSRKLNIKYQNDPPTGGEKKYVNVLNGTAFSMNRPIIVILENYQQEDGSVLIPEVLQKYIGKKIINPQK
ncbi:MAG: serine--tRNA ligase [bacterium]|nr:serine--tRNA ligase [bacterium]